jgi:hypothetical protein
VPEPVHVFRVLVAVLALAAAVNHGWHHARQQHYLAERLTRVSRRDGQADLLVIDRPSAGAEGKRSAS